MFFSFWSNGLCPTHSLPTSYTQAFLITVRCSRHSPCDWPMETQQEVLPKAHVKLIWLQKEPCCNLDWSSGLESLPSFRGHVTLDKPVKLSGPGSGWLSNWVKIHSPRGRCVAATRKGLWGQVACCLSPRQGRNQEICLLEKSMESKALFSLYGVVTFLAIKILSGVKPQSH